MYLFTMCCVLYAPMRILRLADQKVVAMDKLYFYVLQAERMLPKYLAEAIDAEYLISPRLRAVLEDTTHYPKVSAHTWNFTYYRPITDILRRMGCIVTSKVLGNGDKAN